MIATIRNWGLGALGIGILAGLMVLMFFFVSNALEWAKWLMPWLIGFSNIAFAVTVLLLFPLSFVRYTRDFVGGLLIAVSFLFGITVLVWGALITYSLWGGFWVFVGLFFFGVGPVFMALVATLLKGLWSPFFQLLMYLALTMAVRFYGVYLGQKAENEKQRAFG